MTARQLVPPVVRVAEDNDDDEDDEIDLRLELDDDDDFAIVKGDYASGEAHRVQAKLSWWMKLGIAVKPEAGVC